VAEARRFVGEILADLAYELRDAVTVMVSELSTNALVHASTGFDVAIERSDDAVVVSVSDLGDGRPEVQSPGSSEPHGRGLRIVEALSDEWGITTSSETGKTIWFRISLQRSSLRTMAGNALAPTGDEGVDRSDLRDGPLVTPAAVSESDPSDQPSAHLRPPRRHPRAPQRHPRTTRRTPGYRRSPVPVTA
jgi:anti-sigma regulatory factor (Ser/Thr protein kinase)